MKHLKKLRNQLDLIDTQISVLLNERLNIVDQIGHYKRINRLPVADIGREKEIFNHVLQLSKHPILREKIRSIYAAILKSSKLDQEFFRDLECPIDSIGVIGLGLIGGSVCKALKLKAPHISISVFDIDETETKKALDDLWIDRVCSSVDEIVLNTDVLMIATPISTIIHYAKEAIEGALKNKKKLLLLDVASVKGGIITEFENLTRDGIELIGTHPMAGKEVSGFANSEASLFTGAPWIIVPHDKNSDKALLLAEKLVHFLGARPMRMKASEHDRRAAMISHVPAMLSKAYLDFIKRTDPQAIHMAGPGFLDFTRLAHDNPDLRLQIEYANKSCIETSLEEWRAFCEEWLSSV